MSVRLRFFTILLFIVFVEYFGLTQISSQTGTNLSDRDKAGLRGPVKTVVDEQTLTTFEAKTFISTEVIEYSPDGRFMERRHDNPDGSQWVTAYTYAADGRLLKVSYGKDGTSPDSETTYQYDEQKRLLGTKSGDRNEIRYQYDETGGKTMIESYSQEPLQAGVAYVSHWDGTDLGFGRLPGGKVVTSYNEKDVAIGAKFYDTQAKLVGHIERQFDAQGRVISEKQIADAPELLVPEEFGSQLNSEQLKAVGGFMAAGMHDRGISYSYDAQGRMTQRRRNGGVFGEEVTATTYNEQGDKTLETTTAAMNPEFGKVYGLSEGGVMVPTGNAPPAQPPSTYETKYTYEYDQRGNWTEQKVESRSTSGEPYTTTTTYRRKLTYY
jgi:YD repeat-containing protein